MGIKDHYAQKYLGKEVTVTIDRPLGSKHPKHDFIYRLNYGFVPDSLAPDGEETDAYVLAMDKPLKTFTGICIAVIHRTNDDDDKLVVVPTGINVTDDQIREMTEFQEKFFIRLSSGHKERWKTKIPRPRGCGGSPPRKNYERFLRFAVFLAGLRFAAFRFFAAMVIILLSLYRPRNKFAGSMLVKMCSTTHFYECTYSITQLNYFWSQQSCQESISRSENGKHSSQRR